MNHSELIQNNKHRGTTMLARKGWIFVLIFFLTVGVGLSGNASLSNRALSAEKVIENYIQASGGSALEDIKVEQRKGTLLRGTSGKVPLEIIAKIPGKWRYTQTFAWGDQVCYGSDGRTAWMQDTKSVREMSPRQRLDMQLLFDVQAPLKMHEFYPEMKITGSEAVGDREATTVRAQSQEGFTAELAFDRQTGLLLRADDICFEDYRDVGQVKRPFRILLGKNREGQHRQMIMQFTEIRHDINADDSLFLKPSCVLPFAEAPLYKSRKQVDVSIEALEACVGVYQHPQNPKLSFRVSRQQNHLMVKGPGWGQSLEIKPESETDYFIHFLGWEFHFIKNEAGSITDLEVVAGQTFRLKKIE